MKLIEFIKEWFNEIDEEQQDFVSHMFLSISPLCKNKTKARKNTAKNFRALLDSPAGVIEEVGMILAIISTMDFVLARFDDVDNALDRYNELQQMKKDLVDVEAFSIFAEERLATAGERFQNQKYAKMLWDGLKASLLTRETIDMYFFIGEIEVKQPE